MRNLARLALALAPALLFAQKLPFNTDALLKIQRISDPQVSPDGKTVAFGVSSPDVAGNRSVRSIWAVPLAGGTPQRLADGDRPRWSPDGTGLYYVTGGQIWRMNPDGSGTSQVTHLAPEASGETVSPDGKYLLVTSDVYPECSPNGTYDDACNGRKVAEARDSKVKAHLITSLLYRHWTSW